MPFGLWTRVDLRNHVLDGVHIAPCEGAFWGEKDMPADLSPLTAANALVTAGAVVALLPVGDECIRRREG